MSRAGAAARWSWPPPHRAPAPSAPQQDQWPIQLASLIYLITHASGHAAHATSSDLAWLVVAAVGVFVGLQFGGRTMMRHVGEREYRSRIAASKTVSSLWSYWWRDAK